MGKMCYWILVVVSALGLAAVSVGCAGGQILAGRSMTGTWNLVVDTPSGSGTPLLQLKQEGTMLSGKYQGAFGEAPLTGEVKGPDFVIRFTNGGLPMTYTGKVEGRKMVGAIDFGGQGRGTFRGLKD